GKDTVEVPTIGTAQRARGEREIQHHEVTTGAKHAAHFPQGSRVIRHVSQPEGNRHEIEAGIFEWQRECVCDLGASDATAGGMGKHFSTEISGNDFTIRTNFLDLERKIAGATGDIEKAARRKFADAAAD